MADSDKTHRVQLDFHSRAYAELTRLKERSGARSIAEVIRKALVFLRWFLDTQDAGEEVLIRRKDGTIDKLLSFKE